MELKQKIQQSFAATGLTKPELAAKIGFTREYIDMVLSGRRAVSLQFLKAALPVLRSYNADPGVTVDDLIRQGDF